ncbi:enoyl-CoA hydratase-related protein [Marimonas lutisalis]|uniref:enoyl-CoA hydratase-related protein n=1 Tax=Marimonas lutisalis TaxID=2545756 RepID=UPI0010F586D9|nr:enoyl-CoA hydratase-related protein [Marimonas lutisalis]
MAQGLAYRVEDGIAVLSVGELPVRLNESVRKEIEAALTAVEDDPAVTAIVITGQGRSFPAGPSLSEISSGNAAKGLGALCRRIETFPKPVVAALRGAVRDGGLALALAAHLRVAVAGTKLGATEIELGLLPYAGVTQRLPRLVGAGVALELIAGARMILADNAALRPLFAEIVKKNVVGAAARHAREFAHAAHLPQAREAPGFEDPLAFQGVIADWRTRADLSPELRSAIDCVEAAQLLPIEVGLNYEQVAFGDLRKTTRADALLHMARVERLVPVPRVAAPESVVIFGEGRMARGLAIACLEAEMNVHVAERAAGGAERLIREIGESFREAVDSGRLDGRAAQAHLSRISGGDALDYMSRGEIVIEASGVPVGALDEVADLLMGATTGDVPILLSSGVALHSGDKSEVFGGRIMGAAFQPPPQKARLVEFVVGHGTETQARERVEALFRALGKYVLHLRPANGGLIQTLAATLFAAAEWCVARGAAPWDVDAALGWRYGPFAMIDREGVRAQPTRLAAIGGMGAAGSLNETLLAAGRDGRAAGKGFFRYDDGDGAPKHDPALHDILGQWRGLIDRPVPGAEEIRRRILLALVSKGLELLEQGRVSRPGEIDLAAAHGLGMPRALGGPMKAAETMGLLRVRRALAEYAAEDPVLWRNAPLLDEHVKYGRGFGD